MEVGNGKGLKGLKPLNRAQNPKIRVLVWASTPFITKPTPCVGHLSPMHMLLRTLSVRDYPTPCVGQEFLKLNLKKIIIIPQNIGC